MPTMDKKELKENIMKREMLNRTEYNKVASFEVDGVVFKHGVMMLTLEEDKSIKTPVKSRHFFSGGFDIDRPNGECPMENFMSYRTASNLLAKGEVKNIKLYTA